MDHPTRVLVHHEWNDQRHCAVDFRKRVFLDCPIETVID